MHSGQSGHFLEHKKKFHDRFEAQNGEQGGTYISYLLQATILVGVVEKRIKHIGKLLDLETAQIALGIAAIILIGR